MTAVEARGWGWRHAGRQAWAVRGLDLRIEEGERVLLLGASGSGKSTLLAAIAGLLDGSAGQSEGTLLVAGGPAAAVREGTGLLFQDPETQLVMARAGDELAFPLENRCVPREELWERVDRELAATGLGIGRTHPTGELSGGEQQRLALGAVLVSRPRLLLLDEPTANLDADAAAALRARLRAGAETLLLVEHRIGPLLSSMTRVVALDGERGLIADGPPEVVFGRDAAALAAAGIWTPDVAVVPRRGTAGAPVLEARAVSYRHPGAASAALAPTDLVLRSGEALALTGRNGAGKTTLALLLGGLLRPASGSVEVAPALAAGRERSLWRMPARALVSRVGSVFQDPSQQFVRRSVAAELALGPERAGLGAVRSRAVAAELMERLALTHLAAADPFTLSGGEQRRLSVAAALAAAPGALILDEPTFGQDRRGHAELLALLDAQRAAGGALAFATHDPLLVHGLADRTHELAA